MPTTNDLIDKALERAKQLGEAAVRARPVIERAVARAAHEASAASAQAQPHLEKAAGRLDRFIAMGKSALDARIAARGRKPGDGSPPR